MSPEERTSCHVPPSRRIVAHYAAHPRARLKPASSALGWGPIASAREPACQYQQMANVGSEVRAERIHRIEAIPQHAADVTGSQRVSSCPLLRVLRALAGLPILDFAGALDRGASLRAGAVCRIRLV